MIDSGDRENFKEINYKEILLNECFLIIIAILMIIMNIFLNLA